jgi:type II secretory ATPase GspE/PulE/Tfp pilus assembly ATPase PilB-like protein
MHGGIKSEPKPFMTIHFDEDKQNQRLRHLLLDEEEKSVQILAQKYGLQYIDLTRIPINTDGLRLIPEGDARTNNVAIFNIIGKKISMAVRSPDDESLRVIIDDLQSKGYEPTLFMTSMQSLTKAWDRYKDLSFAFKTEEGSLDISTSEIESLLQRSIKLPEITQLITEALATKKSHMISHLLSIIMAGALATSSSDVHIEPEESFARLRYRMDGVLAEAIEFNLEVYRLLLARIKLLSGLKLNIKEAAQDGRFTVRIYTSDIEIRTSTIPGNYGESIVMRVLNPKAISTNLEELGISTKLLDLLKLEISRPNGLILTTGPTGSGKTTTLYAFLRYTQSPDYKVITIEDPIEYHLPGIVQTQIDETRGYTFDAGLKAAMRQDPDIIMVGEIRDSETANTAIQASLTGHMVYSTLHTNNAAGTYTRLVDLGVDPKVLTSAIRVAIAQRLVRKICPDCRFKTPIPESRIPLITEVFETTKKYIPDAEELKEFIVIPTEVYASKGCENCNHTGFKGRIGVYEAILSDKAIEAIIRENPSEREIRAASLPQGIPNMKQDGVFKVLKGVTTFEELERVVDIALEPVDIPPAVQSSEQV